MKINIITSGFVFNNVRSLLFPIIKFENFFRSRGIEFNLLKKINTNCDIIFIESNFIGKRYVQDFSNLKDDFKRLRKNVKKIIYFDTSDSTSILHPKLINYVDVYCKGQILKNLENYKYKYYGNRIFTDYAHRNFGITDKNKTFSEKLNKDNLKKIKVYWNAGLMNHSFLGKIYSHFYSSLPMQKLLNYPKPKTYIKKNQLFFAMTTDYTRNTIAWQRKYALKKISLKPNLKRVSIFKYYKKLSESKVCLSPFGWGEINYRDFESFTYATLLVKPDMNHLKTWPQLYNSKNMVSYNWSCNDLKNKINQIEQNEKHFSFIATSAQKNYLNFLNSKDLELSLLKRILNIINF